MRVLVVGNRGDDDAGFVGERLAQRGGELSVRHRDHPETLAGPADVVLVLGSEWSVYWEHVAPNVAAEAALLRDAHGRGVPVLGICFGAQMAAHALGGTVHRAVAPEIGWYEIDSHEPLVIERGPWMQWHYDTFTVPPEAKALARSAVGPQAFVAGRTLAVQFHPEVDDTVVARWIGSGGEAELVAIGQTPGALLARTRSENEAARRRAHRLVDWFLDEVAAR
ncbi:MAG TPA: gamma-glutamyl-gamma-aminobutyrate hydrolase family protein [Acidimicrobiales bacterium]